MTRIVLVIEPEFHGTYTIDDPRSPRELVKLINTGQLVIGQGEMRMEGHQQWAMAHTEVNVVTIVLAPPAYQLTPRHYDVLFGIVDGKRAEQMANELGIARRTVYRYIAELKERFGVPSKAQVILLAMEQGMF